jgi:hypothetical protein
MSDEKKSNPSDHFDDPRQVLDDGELSKADKIEVLTNWANEIRLLLVAEEENMGGSQELADRLAAVEQALLSLGEDDVSHDAKA